jgi:cysteine/glycine-rich protein
MSGKFAKFGGGGKKCTVCGKTVYPAETVQFEGKPYHAECFNCSDCGKKKLQPSNASLYEDKIYCSACFKKNGFAQKQTKIKWTPKTSTGSSKLSGRFGGGGNKCTVCEKTVYPAETVWFEKKPYHTQCFACSECKKKIASNSDANLYDDKLFCKQCFSRGGYAQKQSKVTWKKSSSSTSALSSKFGGGGTKCVVCGKTVYPAEMLSFEKEAYHAGCFKCGDCGKKLTPSDASRYDGVNYCKLCFGRGGYAQKQAKVKWTPKASTGTESKIASKFGGGGSKCKICGKTVYPAETIQFEGFPYHESCFRCSNCDQKVTVNGAEYSKAKDSVFCRKCFMELGLNRATLTETTAE